MNLVTIFFTGLFAGALTCLAVQGGLLAASIAQREEEKLKDKTKKSVVFITHNIQEAVFLADRVFVLNNENINEIKINNAY